MRGKTASLAKRFAVLMIGQALPEASALSSTLNHAKSGMVYAVVGGVLIGALVLLGCFGLYLWLRYEEFGMAASLGLAALAVAVLAAVFLIQAKRQMQRAAAVKKKMQLFSGEKLWQEALHAFIDGLTSPLPERVIVEREVIQKDVSGDVDAYEQNIESIRFTGRRGGRG